MDDSEESQLFDLYLNMLDDTENPTEFHRWTLISSIAAMLGRNIYLPFGVDGIYPNMFIVLIGASASRKSHSIAIGRKILRMAGYEKFASSKSSKEKFMEDLAIGFDNIDGAIENQMAELVGVPPELREPCEVLISAGELEDFMGRNNGEFISMLTNLYDPQPSYSIRKLRSNSTYVHEPTLNLIGGATNTTFNNTFPPEIAGQGFLSRLTLVHGAGARRKIAWPTEPDKDIMQFISANLMKIRSQVKGKFTVSEEAYIALDEIYREYKPLDDIRFESYNGRRHIHLLKLCMVYAAADIRTQITYKDVLNAHTTLVFTENSMPAALGEFGKSKHGETLTRIIELCKQRGNEPITIKELWKSVAHDFEKREDLLTNVKKLVEAGKLELINQDSVIAVDRDVNRKIKHVKFELLKEYREQDNEQPTEPEPEYSADDLPVIN